MDFKIRLSSHDPIAVLDSKLKAKYGASLFDFAYLLAIALNEGFLPRAYFGFGKKELSGVKALLNTSRRKLSKYEFLQDLIKEVVKGLHYIDRQGGRGISEKKKLLLLWGQLLIKEYKRPVKYPFRGKDMKITEKSVLIIDWNDYHSLLGWFYKRLLGFSYSSLIKPRPDKQEEKRYAKSLLEKNYSDYERRASEALMMYKLAQHYFLGTGPLRHKAGAPRIKVYPLVQIGFYKDKIETLELRSRGRILTTRVRFVDRQKKFDEPEETKARVRYPTILFQNETPFVVGNYSPPGYSSSNGIDQLFADAISGSQNTKKP